MNQTLTMSILFRKNKGYIESYKEGMIFGILLICFKKVEVSSRMMEGVTVDHDYQIFKKRM